MIDKNDKYSKKIKKPRSLSNGKITEYYKKRLLVYLLGNLPPFPEEKKEMIKKAYLRAFAAHYGVFRKGGDHEPYITHPVEVALIVANEMGFGATSITAALLHDVLEDCEECNIEEMTDMFGEKVATIVDGVTKITRISGKEQSKQVETFKKMILSIPKDFRVLLIKVADRLHNMRTMDDMPDYSRRIKSSENLYLYTKIAEMAGFWEIKKELEDRSFRYLFPEEYSKIENLSKKYDSQTLEKIHNFQKILKNSIYNKLDYEIKTVSRSLYSTWQKMLEKKISYKNIHNRFSTRIVIDTPQKLARDFSYDFYLQITDFFYEKDRSLRDWIKKPKPNGFRALIFDVMDAGDWREIQIMSKEDDQIATRGLIKGKKMKFPGLEKIAIEVEKNIDPAEGTIMDRFKDIINPSKIYVFTPKGENIELPKGATVLDMAFRIHTDLGLKCLGAKINDNEGAKSPNYVLQSSQKVEILTSDSVKPKKEWLDIVKTSRAKKSLNNYFKNTTKKDEHFNDEIEFSNKKPLVINDSVKFKLARCCNPIIGDKAMAYKSPNGEIIIHKENCTNAVSLRATDSANTTSVIWEHIDFQQGIWAEIEFEGFDRMGILKDIIQIITSDLEINMKKIYVENFDSIFKGKIEVYVSTVELLNETIKRIQEVENVNKAWRNY
jgi:GTP pyrophosphokinase